jgi:hypothetical protein
MATKSENEILRLVLHRLENGEIPSAWFARVAAGYGVGGRCAACDEPITSDQVEYEVCNEQDGTRLTFHMGCHRIWETALGRIGPSPDNSALR